MGCCHSYPFPSFWPPQSTSFAAVPLNEESPEWRGVCDSLCQSMRDAEVVGITRVQNRHLWEQHRHVELHTGSLGFEATPNRMWCSTHLTPPLEVVSSVDGLRPWTAVRGSSVYLQCAVQASSLPCARAPVLLCLCLFPQTRGRSGRGEDFAEKAIDFHRRAYVKPGSDGVRQLVLCRVVPHSDHKPCRPKPGCDRSGEVVRVTQLSHVYPEFIVSYTCD